MRKVQIIEQVSGTQTWEVLVPDNAPRNGLDLLNWIKYNDFEYEYLIDSNLTIDSITIGEI